MATIKIDEQNSGQRIDTFLSNSLQVPRNRVKELLKKQKFAISGSNIIKASHKLRIEEEIEYNPDDLESQTLPTEFDEDQAYPEIRVIFENEDFMILDKPANLITHPKLNINEQSVVSFLLHHYPEIKDVGEDRLRPGIVHRLDQDTSGILLVAKNNDSFKYFKNLFKTRKIKKKYTAVVFGRMRFGKGIVENPIARSPKEINKYFTTKNKAEDQKFKAKEAVTHYRRLKYSSQYSFIEAMPKTGRTHQIRVHLTSLGYPIVGDKVYSFKNHKTPNHVKRQLLHAESISFTHKDEEYYFESPLLKDMDDFVKVHFGPSIHRMKMHSRYKPDNQSL